jgi:hypothetical protein
MKKMVMAIMVAQMLSVCGCIYAPPPPHGRGEYGPQRYHQGPPGQGYGQPPRGDDRGGPYDQRGRDGRKAEDGQQGPHGGPQGYRGDGPQMR